VLRGTLTIVVTYEPPARKTKANEKESLNYFKGGVHNDSNANLHNLQNNNPASRRKNKQAAAVAAAAAAELNNNNESQQLQHHHHRGIKMGDNNNNNNNNNSVNDPGVPSSLLSPSGGYEQAIDPKSGRTYWYNRMTQDRTWVDPNILSPSALTAPTPRW